MAQVPDTMRAVVAPKGGGPEVLTLVDRPVPKPGEGEILVRVAAAGVNRPDVLQRLGHYPPPPGAPDILGLEIAGEVAAVGPGVSRFSAGQQVMGLVAGGGYAQYAVVHETNALAVPAGV
jgi:NADPH2:quinone reductase